MQRYWLSALLPAMLSLPMVINTWRMSAYPDDEPRDGERLGMAIEYFQSGKYHEALLIFEKLDKEYELNARYHAYMGVCCYYEWLYEDACRYLDEAIPQLDAFAPHERSVYYYCNGESHFQLQQYEAAIPYFERALTVCYENEKGDIHYRLGLCYMFAKRWQEAHDHYRTALDNYLTYRDTPDMRARIHQTAHMMKGCEEHLKKNPEWGVNYDMATTNDTVKATIAREAQETDSMPGIQLLSPQMAGAITLPSMATQPTFNLPTKIDMPHILATPVANTAATKKDTIRSEVPQTMNIQDIYNQKVEVKD